MAGLCPARRCRSLAASTHCRAGLRQPQHCAGSATPLPGHIIEETPNGPALTHLLKFFTNVLRWDDGDLTDAPAELEFALPEYGEVLQANYAVREPEPTDTDNPWVMLLKVLPHGDDFDSPSAADDRGWNATPEAKFERLLREAEVPIGLLLNATHIRLVYSPRGETSGYLTFPLSAMTEVAGQPLRSLQPWRCSYPPSGCSPLPRAQRRSPQFSPTAGDTENDVSTRLAGQVLAGLYEAAPAEMQAADDHSHGDLLRDVLSENPDLVYEGLLTNPYSGSSSSCTQRIAISCRSTRSTPSITRLGPLRSAAHRRRTSPGFDEPAIRSLGSVAVAISNRLRRRSLRRHALANASRTPLRSGPLSFPGRPTTRRPAVNRRPHRCSPWFPMASSGTILQGLLVLDGERLSYVKP